jgi:hypothetical protein
MTAPGTWRSLRSIMLVTLHVAAVATLIRYGIVASHREGSLVLWVPVSIVIATFISWPISRAILSEFKRDHTDFDRTCPLCRRDELRPLVRPGEGIFQPVSSYRCAGCWTTVQMVGDSKVIEPHVSRNGAVSSSGIRFLDESTTEAEIRFLDDPRKLPG